MSIHRECCNYCMWYGPVNQDRTMRRHRPPHNDGTVGGRKVQDMTAAPCPGSNKPYARFGCDSETTTSEETSMVEYGVFKDEGCTDVFDAREEANAKADEYRAEDGGYYADLISVHEMCPDHRDEGQPKGACEECLGEADEPGCEGHYDDDHSLLTAGIGEPTYCDGSCDPRR